MIKIFLLIASIKLGGSENVALSIAEHCKLARQDDFEFVIVELFPTRDAYALNKKQKLVSQNIRTITLAKTPKRMSLLPGPLRLVYFLLKEKPQIVHSHTDLPDLVLSTTLRILSFFGIKKPKIIRTIHSTQLWPTHFNLGKYTEKAFSDEWICGVSEPTLKAYNELRRKYLFPVSAHQQIINNGCIIPDRKPHPFNIDTAKINIAFCGRFEDYKGMDVLIPCIQMIYALYPGDFLFHIIGSGTFQHEIDKLANDYDTVLVYEAVPDIAAKLYDFDYLFMPSHFEGLALMSIEASFAKIPVIATFASGLKETLPHDWPLMFHKENREELMAVFEKIKNKSYDYEKLKNQAFRFVNEHFSMNKMIDTYAELYRRINE